MDYNLYGQVIICQVMLSNPVLENAVNLDAVQMLIHHPHAYKQMVQDCVSASQRVEGRRKHNVGDGGSKPLLLTPPPSFDLMKASSLC